MTWIKARMGTKAGFLNVNCLLGARAWPCSAWPPRHGPPCRGRAETTPGERGRRGPEITYVSFCHSCQVSQKKNKDGEINKCARTRRPPLLKGRKGNLPNKTRVCRKMPWLEFVIRVRLMLLSLSSTHSQVCAQERKSYSVRRLLFCSPLLLKP